MSTREQLIINVSRSKQLCCFLFVIHGLAAASLILLSTSLFVIFPAMAALAFSLKHYIARVCEVSRIIALPDSEWLIEKNNGQSFSASIAGDTYVGRWLTLLVFNSLESSSTSYVSLLNDSLEPSVLSRLKLKLKVDGCEL